MEEKASLPTVEGDVERVVAANQNDYVCDRCGSAMVEQNCKVLCLNCGNRFDCSDLNLHFD